MADKFTRRDNIVREFKKESGGSFSTIYQALKVTSRQADTSTDHGRKLSKDKVLKEIRNILGTTVRE